MQNNREYKFILAIDFDGVIHNHANPIPGRRMGPPIEGAREALEKFVAQEYEIIIFSVWAHDAGATTIEAWMNYYQIPFHQITNIKPKADLYLDDHAQKFISWDQVKI